MKLVVVRHGETDENLTNITQGQSQSQLTPTGKAQAQQLALTLKSANFDAVFCSDLDRCKDTLSFVNKFHKLPVVYTAELREYSYGIYEGQLSTTWSWTDIPGDDLYKKVPGGESAIEVAERVAECVNDAFEQHTDDTVLFCTHGGPIRLLRVLFGECEYEDRFKQPVENCSIWYFEMTSKLPSLEKITHG